MILCVPFFLNNFLNNDLNNFDRYNRIRFRHIYYNKHYFIILWVYLLFLLENIETFFFIIIVKFNSNYHTVLLV